MAPSEHEFDSPALRGLHSKWAVERRLQCGSLSCSTRSQLREDRDNNKVLVREMPCCYSSLVYKAHCAKCQNDLAFVCSGLHNKIPQTGWLQQQKLIFSLSVGQNFHTKVWQGWFLVSSLLLICRWPPSCVVLTW